MKYQVVVETPTSAVVKTAYLNPQFKYIFLDITFEPASTGHTIKEGKGKYLFTSVPAETRLPVGHPDRYKVIPQEFHRRSDVNTQVKASSLSEACTAFFESFGDTFEIIREVPARQPKAAAKPRAGHELLRYGVKRPTSQKS
ncbi:MAG TPA: hypothetical protein VFO76_13380 [Candidatus Kapabacteria bacterium]|nr:hypothetical protein [Candidatus Kapabacteria bacterium]